MKFSNSFVVIYATILQLITGGFIIFSPEPLRVARLGVFYDLFMPYYVGGLLMIVAAFLSIIGLVVKNRFSIFFFIPQYYFLLFMSASALYQVTQGQYADGVTRPWQFILIDQLPDLTITALYIFSIIDFRKNHD